MAETNWWFAVMGGSHATGTADKHVNQLNINLIETTFGSLQRFPDQNTKVLYGIASSHSKLTSSLQSSL